MNKLMCQCSHGIGGKFNEIGEILVFCELTDQLENVTLGCCIGNCEEQACNEVCSEDVTLCGAWDTDKCLLHR